MALPILDWAQSAVYVPGATSATAWLANIKDALDAEAGPMEAKLYSAGNYLTVGPSDPLSPVADMRIIFGVGALPAARLADQPSGDSNYLWAGVSPDAGDEALAGAWTDATVWTTARFGGFAAVPGWTTCEQIYLMQGDEALALIAEDTASAPTTHVVFPLLLGALGVPSLAEYAEADGRMYQVWASGAGSIAGIGSAPWTTSNSSVLWPGTATTISSSKAYTYTPGTGSMVRIKTIPPTGLDGSQRWDGTGQVALQPQPIYRNSDDAYLGTLRQIYPYRGLRRQVLQDGTPADTGYLVAIQDGTVNGAVLFANG